MCMTERFVARPNLPEARVSFAAVSGVYREIPEALEARGVRCLRTEPDPRLSPQAQHHADMQLLHLNGNRTFVLSGAQKLKTQLLDEGFEVAETENTPLSQYPGDVLCNVLLLADKLFANLGAMDPAVCVYTEALGFKTVHVNQGYARCATAVVNAHAIITMDSGIYAAAQFFGVEALLIPERSIYLDGHAYGFIGGCCGLIDKNTLAFTGTLQSLNCAEQIKAFLEKHGVQPVELTQNTMIDVGGILPLKEYAPTVH